VKVFFSTAEDDPFTKGAVRPESIPLGPWYKGDDPQYMLVSTDTEFTAPQCDLLLRETLHRILPVKDDGSALFPPPPIQHTPWILPQQEICYMLTPS